MARRNGLWGPLGLFVCGRVVPLSYSHTGRCVVLSAASSLRNVLVIILVLSYHVYSMCILCLLSMSVIVSCNSILNGLVYLCPQLRRS